MDLLDSALLARSKPKPTFAQLERSLETFLLIVHHLKLSLAMHNYTYNEYTQVIHAMISKYRKSK